MEGKNGEGELKEETEERPEGREKWSEERRDLRARREAHGNTHTAQHTTTATASPHAINRRSLEQANDVQRRELRAPTLIVEQVHIPHGGRLGRNTSPRQQVNALGSTRGIHCGEERSNGRRTRNIHERGRHSDYKREHTRGKKISRA